MPLLPASSRSPLPWLTTVLAAALLVACPESPPDVDEGGAGAGAGPAGAPVGGAPGGAAGDGGSAAPPPAGGAGGGGGTAPELDPEMENPQHSQEDLASDSDAATVTGTIVCDDGEGPYRLRLFVPPPDLGGPEADEETSGPPSPLVNVEIEDAGAFSFKTPKADALVVLAYEDLDENGLPTLEEPQFGPLQGNPVPFSGDVSDLTLDCSKPLPAPEPRMDTVAAGGEEGAPAGGPPVDAVPAAADGTPPVEGGPPPEGEMLPPDGAQGPPPAGMATPPPAGEDAAQAPPGDAPAGGPPPE